MAGFYNLENREVIRVKVKKCDGLLQPEYKKFSVDPQITSFEMLQGILAKAFEIKGDFTISYLASDSEGQDVYLSMLSDWDMDAAFQCASDPCLKLKVDLKPFEEGSMDEWDVIAPVDVPQHKIANIIERNSLLGTITGTITSGVGKTMNTVQRAMGFKQTEEELYRPIKPPMSDMEFHNYLDSAGLMVKPQEFRLSIYQGGIEPSLRRVAWRHLLNIFPLHLSGRERFDYLKRKEREYYDLRDEWKEKFINGSVTEEVKYVASMVKKDVLRTDRTHKFYAGADDNKNVLSLFHILVTYALTHPNISYCQGMSDIASPILVIQKDEAQAYLCFCGLMKHLHVNFKPDGAAMMMKFSHLADLMQLHDTVFFKYLQNINAGDLFFCYRWLLLGLKREFPFDDALYMLEVMWSTLPPDPPVREIELTDYDYNVRLLSSSPCSPTVSFQQTVYAKLLSMRHFACSVRPKNRKEHHDKIASNSVNNNSMTFFDSSPVDDEKNGNTQDYPRLDDPDVRAMERRSSSINRFLEDMQRVETSQNGPSQLMDNDSVDEGVDEVVNGMRSDFFGSNGDTTDDQHSVNSGVCDVSNSDVEESSQNETEQQMQFNMSLETKDAKPESTKVTDENISGSGLFSSMKKLLSSPKKKPANISIPKEISSMTNVVENGTSNGLDISDAMSNSGESMTASKIAQRLPPPQEFGCGNPFLMFMCLTLLLQHREPIMKNSMGYEEVAMHFDKMVRRHRVHKVLHMARQLYSDYLRTQQSLVLGDGEFDV
ncbi:LOW QUALITY PROTEIN: TBC1 domain family member 25-like [Gigantopelta aegis]|uniref:LOW QUALITY PROTEIN: TBC1 domain family member 25-like n=1 Tax=Gigantopelta aegis TaxID=1735272 RepID=UPI001B888784|nr:LOW QUALITY PROTEIN: TBC1 domain family member 25-like [Gigantopelta aegis]